MYLSGSYLRTVFDPSGHVHGERGRLIRGTEIGKGDHF